MSAKSLVTGLFSDIALLKSYILVVISIIITLWLAFESNIYFALLGVAQLVLIFFQMRTKPMFVKGKIWLWNMYANHEDGREFGALQVDQLSPEDIDVETIWDTEKKRYWLYFTKNRYRMIDMTVLDPDIPSKDISPHVDHYQTDIEWRNQGQLRNYIKRKVQGASAADIQTFLSTINEQALMREMVRNSRQFKEIMPKADI